MSLTRYPSTPLVGLGAGREGVLAQSGAAALPALLRGDMSGALGAALDDTSVVFRTAVTPEITVNLGALVAAMVAPPAPGAEQPIDSVTEPALPFLRPEVSLISRGQVMAEYAPYGQPPRWFWPVTLGLAGTGLVLGVWTVWRAFGPRRAR